MTIHCRCTACTGYKHQANGVYCDDLYFDYSGEFARIDILYMYINSLLEAERVND